MSAGPILTIDIVTLFPAMFDGPLTQSVLGRGQKAGAIGLRIHDLRTWSDDVRHRKVDDRPYGGGAGMVIQAEPVYRAIRALGGTKRRGKPHVVYMSPQGTRLDQAKAASLAAKKRLVLICGHYEGLDERVMPWIDEEISIGDYVLTGGEIPAMVLADAVARLVPGVVGDPESIANESFSKGLLDYPHYTRPSLWRGKSVPETLLSGNHREIERWRSEAARAATQKKRPEILKQSGTARTTRARRRANEREPI